MRDRLSEAAYLFFSFGPFFEGEDFEAETSEAERTELWAKYKREILVRYLAELRQKGPGSAGRRPEYFWRDLADQGHTQRQTPPGKFSAQRLWDRQRRAYGWVETDWECLNRLGRLEPWEVEAGDPQARRVRVTEATAP